PTGPPAKATRSRWRASSCRSACCPTPNGSRARWNCPTAARSSPTATAAPTCRACSPPATAPPRRTSRSSSRWAKARVRRWRPLTTSSAPPPRLRPRRRRRPRRETAGAPGVPAMNLRDLYYLVALADHRHFGRAAAACFVSQPTLSTQIRKLEEELGVALVERNPRQVMLTPAGRAATERARRIVSEVEQLKETARRDQDQESGTVRLGLFPTLAPYLLPHAVPAIRDRFPELELLLVEEKSDVLMARLREGRLDAAILALPVEEEQLHSEVLFEEEFVMAVPHSHPLAG